MMARSGVTGAGIARRALCLSLLAALVPAGVLAQVHAAVLSDADQAALVGVARYLNGLRTLKARFLQIGPDGVTTQGTMWLQRPGRMRFQYDKPSPLLLVAGHGSVVFHDAQLDQTTNIPVGNTPLGLLLSDTITLSGDVTLTEFQKPPGQLRLTLVRTRTAGDGSLTLDLNANPLALTGWSVVDAQGRETQIRISAVELGGSFDQALFTFVDPDDGK
jgi:outer membrane lipoprotein-sorting protein